MLFLRTGVVSIVSGAKARKIFRKSIRHFVEKPLIRYLARGAIRGFLKNRGVWKGGKVKASRANSEGWRKKCTALRRGRGWDYRKHRKQNRRFLKLFQKFENCESAN